MFLILFESGQFVASGMYHLAGSGLEGRPIQALCQVFRTDMSLRCEGTYAGAARHPFKMVIGFDELQLGGTFELRTPHTGDVKGSFGWSETGYDFAGWSTDRLGAVGLHLRQIKGSVFGLSGAVARDDKESLSFDVVLMPDDPLITKANVVAMAKRSA